MERKLRKITKTFQFLILGYFKMVFILSGYITTFNSSFQDTGDFYRSIRTLELLSIPHFRIPANASVIGELLVLLSIPHFRIRRWRRVLWHYQVFQFLILGYQPTIVSTSFANGQPFNSSFQDTGTGCTRRCEDSTFNSSFQDTKSKAYISPRRQWISFNSSFQDTE